MGYRINSAGQIKLIFVLATIFLLSCAEVLQEPTPLPTETAVIKQVEPTVVIDITPEREIEPTPAPILANLGTIQIGYMGPLTGGASFVGMEQMGFVKTVAKIFSEQTGLDIEIIEADTEINPETGVAVANRFVNDPDIVAVIGPAGSQVCEATLPIFESANLAHITPSCTKTDLTNPGTATFFRPIPTDADQSRTLAAHMIVATKIRTLFIVEDQSSYAAVLSDELTLLLNDSGIRIRRMSIDQGETDFSSIADAVISADSDAVFMVAQLEQQTGALAQELNSKGYTGFYYLPDSGFSSGWIDIAGNGAEGAYVSFFSPDPNLVPEAAHYNEAYAAEYGPEFGAFGGAGGLATQVLLKAIEACARTENMSRDCVTNELRFIEMRNTMLGIPIKFDERNQSEGGFSLFQIQNGSFELLAGAGDPGSVVNR